MQYRIRALLNAHSYGILLEIQVLPVIRVEIFFFLIIFSRYLSRLPTGSLSLCMHCIFSFFEVHWGAGWCSQLFLVMVCEWKFLVEGEDSFQPFFSPRNSTQYFCSQAYIASLLVCYPLLILKMLIFLMHFVGYLSVLTYGWRFQFP